MNRLQKKCVIGTAGIHLLLLTILIFGPAFFNRQPKMDNTVLTMIPANVLDDAQNSGVQGAQAPPPQPAVIPPSLLRPPPPPQPAPAPKAVQPPAPVQTPSPSLLKQFEEYFHAKPTPPVTPDLKPVQRTEKSHDDNIKVDLTKRTSTSHKSHPDTTANTKVINSELRSLQKSLSSSTHIDVPGTGAAAMANYGTVVQSIYEQAVVANLPAEIGHNDEHTMVRVTIARDGTVISSSIISPSGDSAWDNAVQRTLNQVTFIRPFPDGATEDQRSYTIDFNPQVARQLQ